jgi:hypothetical protein
VPLVPPARNAVSGGFAMTDSGLATSSRLLPSALTPRKISTTPPTIINPAPSR